jgi:hypothetical protein
MIVTACTLAPFVISMFHHYVSWTSVYLKWGCTRLLGIIHTKLLHQIPMLGHPPDWCHRLPYHLMRRICRHHYCTRQYLVHDQDMSMLISYGALPYGHGWLMSLYASFIRSWCLAFFVWREEGNMSLVTLSDEGSLDSEGKQLRPSSISNKISSLRLHGQPWRVS